jgi:sulfur-carrier protein
MEGSAMARVVFTSHLAGVGPRDEVSVEGATVLAALDAVFAQYPLLEGYVLDDQRRLRKHVTIFVDGARVPAERALDEPVTAGSEIYVLQALSGG